MKKLILLFSLIPALAFGQKEFRETIELGNSNNIFMNFKWPDQVIIKYHDKKEIAIEGTVSINYGKYDNAFTVISERDGQNLRIRSAVQGMDTMEQITVIKEGEGNNKIHYGKDGDYSVISHRNGDHISTGIKMDIFLTVYLPKNVPAVVEAKFGLIEVRETAGPLTVNSKFGGVDVTIDERNKMDLKAATAFGEIFTDLEVDFRGNGKLNKNGSWNRLTTTFAGGGNLLNVESKFGNVYLRRK